MDGPAPGVAGAGAGGEGQDRVRRLERDAGVDHGALQAVLEGVDGFSSNLCTVFARTQRNPAAERA